MPLIFLAMDVEIISTLRIQERLCKSWSVNNSVFVNQDPFSATMYCDAEIKKPQQWTSMVLEVLLLNWATL